MMQVQRSFGPAGSTGTLYLVATPIGNLEDMTYRAVRMLREADLIAAEDTRQTRKLLNHYDIHTRCVSYHEHNKEASGKELVRLLAEGQSIALVSDAGLPAISDPGYELVCAAIEAGIPVVPVPGANAALSALIASGLPTDKFGFLGFLPRDNKGMKTELERWSASPQTLMLYESPHRVEATLARMLEAWGNRRVVLARELTKKHEEFWRGTLADGLAWLAEHPPLGEYVILVEGMDEAEAAEAERVEWQAVPVAEHYERYVREGMDRKEALKRVAKERGVPKQEVYKQLHADSGSE